MKQCNNQKYLTGTQSLQIPDPAPLCTSQWPRLPQEAHVTGNRSKSYLGNNLNTTFIQQQQNYKGQGPKRSPEWKTIYIIFSYLELSYLCSTYSLMNLEKVNLITKFLHKDFNYYKDLQWIIKQEAHGPHRSPEKTVQINKHIWLYHNVD